MIDSVHTTHELSVWNWNTTSLSYAGYIYVLYKDKSYMLEKLHAHPPLNDNMII